MTRLSLRLAIVGAALACAVGPGVGSANAAGWSGPTLIDPSQYLTAVSCASPSFCVAVDDAGNVFMFDGSRWSAGQAIDPSGGGLSSVSCPSTTFCMAADADGNVLRYDGGSWSAPMDVGVSSNRDGVSCTSSTFCLSGGDPPLSYDGSSWSATGPAVVSEVSCASPHLCVGTTGTTATNEVTVYNGSSWSQPRTLASVDNDLFATSCAPTGFCMVGSVSQAYAYNGSGWSGPTQPDSTYGVYYQAALSCTSAQFCMSLGSAQNTDVASTYNGSSWSKVMIVGEAGDAEAQLPTGVSCTSPSFCVAVSGTGDAFVYGASSGPPPAPEGLGVVGLPVLATRGTPYRSPVGVMTVTVPAGQSAPAADSFTVRVRWGDGSRPVAGSVAPERSLGARLGGRAVYRVSAPAHVFRKLTRAPGSMTVTVSSKAGGSMSAESTVYVDTRHPHAAFVASPTDPDNLGLSLLMPQLPLPNQLGIREYRWKFLDDYRPVIDDAQTRPHYRRVLADLAAHPGSRGARASAIKLGILPNDANSGEQVFDDSLISEIASAWRAYFLRSHIVPHFFDLGAGRIGVELMTTDTSGAVTDQKQNLKIVTGGCLPWGGPLSAYFGNLTTCDTLAGIGAQFGAHRSPDYATLNISQEVGELAGLGFNVGVGLTVSRDAVSDPGDSVFLSLAVQAGESEDEDGPSATLGLGWVGPPGPSYTPSLSTVHDFIDGLDFYGGGSIGVLNLGLGWNAVYSPSLKMGGEELFAGRTGVSYYGEASCSAPLSHVTDIDAAQTLYQDAVSHHVPAASTLKRILSTSIASLPTLLSDAYGDLAACEP